MGWLSCAAPVVLIALVGIQLAAFGIAAWVDLSNRVIPDPVCLVIALAGIGVRLLHGPLALAESAALAAALFVVLLLLHARGILGGGDVKLLTAAALGHSFHGMLSLLYATALAGGVLACVHLLMRQLPRPSLAPAGASALRRVYAAERWRILRHAPLPYGIAIACGGMISLLIRTGI